MHKSPIYKIVSKNRRAKFDYEILDTFEVGICLKGSEVKSLRSGKCSIEESHVAPMDTDGKREIYLFNASVQEYGKASFFGHEMRRPRKLLLRKKEINKLVGSVQKKGLSIIPLKMYFTTNGLVKVEIALGRGRKTFDKRALIKERDWKKRQGVLLKNIVKS